MKERLRNIVSILCALALLIGCVPVSAGADGAVETATVTVRWIDENNQAGLRPDSVAASFSAGNQYPVTLDAGNNWTAMIAGVPAGGTWSVQTPAGYNQTSSTRNGQTIVTLAYQAEQVSVGVSVSWNDQNDAKGVRPQSVKARLLADGVPYAAAAPLNSGNSWHNAWTNLPKYRVGTMDPVQYTVEAADSPEFYSMSVSGSAAAGFTLTGELGLGTLTISHAVTGLPAGADLSQLTLIVTGADASLPPTLKMSQLSGGSYTVNGVLPGAYLVQVKNANDLADGYMMDPDRCKLVDAVNVPAGGQGALSTKTAYTPLKTSEELETEGNPDLSRLTFEILGPEPWTPLTITYAQFKNGQFELDGLRPGTYVICERNAETLVDKYELTTDSTAGVVITVSDNGTSRAKLFNRYQPMTPAPTPSPTPPVEETPTPVPDEATVDIPVTKTWRDNNNADGNRPSAVIVRLHADGQPVNSVALNAANGWRYTFTGLPKYAKQSEGEEGKAREIVYTITEDPVEWYDSEIKGYHITNVYHPELTEVSVRKVWDDNKNRLRLRPKSIRVTLSNGKTVVLNDANGWQATVKNLPTRLNGQPAVYTWHEQQVLGYQQTDQTVIDNLTIITNSVWRSKTPPGDKDNPPLIKIDDYNTPLGVEIIINHVGDCYD